MTINVPRAKIGSEEIPHLGFGCMGMSFGYTDFDDEQSKRVLNKVVDLVPGIYLDTADVYGTPRDGENGMHQNESLIGDTLKSRRKEIFLATKFGFVRNEKGEITNVSNEPKWIKDELEGSLKALQTDHVDLLYMHRVNPETPIEKSVAAMAELVKEKKVKLIGLSECTAETLRAAHKVHPIAAVQLEYSLFFNETETNGIFDACRELGITFVAYSPLGRGFLTGAIRSRDDLPEGDNRTKGFPRFSEENFPKNLELVDRIKVLADKKGCTNSQLAIAWTIARGKKLGVTVVPIPGTKKEKYLHENLESANVKLSDAEMDEIQSLLDSFTVWGARYGEAHMKYIPK